MITVTGRETDTNATTLTVRIDHDSDNPESLLAALRALADRATAGANDALTEAHLKGTGAVAGLLTERVDRLRVIARDRDGWSWGQLADALGEARATTRRRTAAARRALAETGAWWDADGLHHETPEVALAIAAYLERHNSVGDRADRYRFVYDAEDGHVYWREPWTAPDGTRGEDLIKLHILPHQMPR